MENFIFCAVLEYYEKENLIHEQKIKMMNFPGCIFKCYCLKYLTKD